MLGALFPWCNKEKERTLEKEKERKEVREEGKEEREVEVGEERREWGHPFIYLVDNEEATERFKAKVWHEQI